mgnify:CR=1 FL=1
MDKESKKTEAKLKIIVAIHFSFAKVWLQQQTRRLTMQADPDKVKVVTDIVYNYNDKNPLNDYKVNGSEQTKYWE